MKYSRTIEFFSSHFNESAYPKYNELTHTLDMGGEVMIHQLNELLKDIHGHNFKATITVSDEPIIIEDSDAFTYSGYLIADEDIVKMINEWSGINLSVHDDFLAQNIRATTENMARVLLYKTQKYLQCSATVTVVIHEAEGISAEASHTFVL